MVARMLICNSEKLMKMDAKRREYDIVVVGEESHLAYNRVGLTSFFQQRNPENLYLNPKDWVNFTLPLTQCCADFNSTQNALPVL